MMSATTSDEPTAQPKMTMAQPKMTMAQRGAKLKKTLTTKEGWMGDYKWGFLCMPELPFTLPGHVKKARKLPPFYALDADLPILLAIVAGFQHSLAMIAGLVTPPIIFASALNLDAPTQSYMISSSLIAAGILSMVQMSRIKLFRNYHLGTGLITVVGTSFATLSTAFSIFAALEADGTCPAAINGVPQPCPDAYGALLGTAMLCSLLEMGMSFVPPQKLRKIFPPIVTGVVVFLIGASLIGDSGIVNWGGGSNCSSFPEPPSIFALCPTIYAPKAATWASPQYIGLGFLSFITIVLTELFGSPFLRNASIIVGLIVGMIVAGPAGYVSGATIKSSPAITFLWVKTFKLKIYGPAILPMMAVYVSLAMEAIGDITASCEASRVEVDGPVFDSRIQGGVLADGLAGLLSGAFTVTPMSIFAQNNGVITLTRCANRKAGYICATFLIIYGVLGKISGVFLAIPNPVLGGVTTFLFATVATSGIRILSLIKWGRRERFILASSLSFGLGNLLVPGIFEHLFDGVKSGNAGLTGFLSSITIILSTPYLAAGIVGVILNLILPHEPVEVATITDNEEEADHDVLEQGDGTYGKKSTSSSDEKDVEPSRAAGSRVVEVV